MGEGSKCGRSTRHRQIEAPLHSHELQLTNDSAVPNHSSTRGVERSGERRVRD
jgi:hypothetical protein